MQVNYNKTAKYSCLTKLFNGFFSEIYIKKKTIGTGVRAWDEIYFQNPITTGLGLSEFCHSRSQEK